VSAAATASARHLTPLDLDALALALAVPAERAERLEHARTCAACGGLLEQDRRARQRFEAEVYARTLPVVRGRLAPPPVRKPPWLAPVLAAAGLAAAALVLVPRIGERRALPPGAAGLGVKGPGALQVFARRQSRVFAVEEGTRLAAGDAIRFFVDPGAADHVLVGSVDGAGQANIYYPYDGRESVRVAAGRRLEVPGSIVLDRAPGPERLFAVFSRAPLSVERVRAALQQLAAGGPEAIRQARELPLPGTAQATLRFEKEPPP
jgi:hypothetical protein